MKTYEQIFHNYFSIKTNKNTIGVAGFFQKGFFWADCEI